MKDLALPTDSPLAEYQAKRMSVQINLRCYYNECVAVMAQEEAGDITMDEALPLFLELDSKYAKAIVDNISPLKPVIVQG